LAIVAAAPGAAATTATVTIETDAAVAVLPQLIKINTAVVPAIVAAVKGAAEPRRRRPPLHPH
jgi:hypothetical protein